MPNSKLPDNLDFDIVDDDNEYSDGAAKAYWTVLVVDDEPEMHQSTTFALKNVHLLGKELNLIHAYSAIEALEIIKSNSDIAVLLLDVVMEESDSGLKLVDQIRGMGFEDMRIVLRTGQPGYAPMFEVVHDYDINDYHTKSEMDRNRLITTILTALRSWQQIRIIKENRRGLEMVVESSQDLFKRKNLELFSQGVLKQLMGIHGTLADGIVCTHGPSNDPHQSELYPVTTTGLFSHLHNSPITKHNAGTIWRVFEKSIKAPDQLYFNGELGIYITTENGMNLFIYINHCDIIEQQQITLLKLFASNVSVSFENLSLIEKLDQLAYIDPVLKIPNFNALNQKLQDLRAAGISDLTLINMHVRSSAQCIGAFGIDVFNHLMQEIYRTLCLSTAQDAFIIASNGKNDLLLLTNKSDRCLKCIQHCLEQSIVVDDIELGVTANTTVVTLNDMTDAHTAVKKSISAMLSAPANHANAICYYEEGMTKSLEHRIILQSQLNKAIQDKGSIFAWLQPKVNLHDGSVVGAEALCRWILNEQLVPPNVFIPISEATGKADKITFLILDCIAMHLARIKPDQWPQMRIAVNLSMQEIQTTGFAKKVDAFIKSLNLSAEHIEFEITESFLMHEAESAIRELSHLKDLGYCISLDDFGTGYSSLSYLDRLPVDYLKIDKSFVDQLKSTGPSYNLVETTISLAKQLKMKVIAEGIETPEQHQKLRDLGCDYGQGYLYGRAVPIESFSQYLN